MYSNSDFKTGFPLIVIRTGSAACANRPLEKAIKANNVITVDFINILND
jgi:hypothetical protein